MSVLKRKMQVKSTKADERQKVKGNVERERERERERGREVTKLLSPFLISFPRLNSLKDFGTVVV